MMLAIALLVIALFAIQVPVSQRYDRRRRERVVARSAVKSICEQINREKCIPERMKYMVIDCSSASGKLMPEHLPDGNISIRILPDGGDRFKVVAYGVESGSAYEVYSLMVDLEQEARHDVFR